jgi:predicted DNA-binding WGR domain protein
MDRARNRFRVYGLTEGRTLFGEPCLRVVWGRLGRPLRDRTEVFASEAALQARRRELMAERKRHQYFAPSSLGASRGLLFAVAVLAATRPPSVRPTRQRGGPQMALGFERRVT